MIENFSDIRLSPEGDFELDDTRDIKLTNLEELSEQKVYIAVNTSNPDWFGDSVGADLEDFLGQEHTKATSERVKKKLGEALTNHGFFHPDNVYIEAKPYNRTTMLLMVFINIPEIGTTQAFRVALDLGGGASVRRVM